MQPKLFIALGLTLLALAACAPGQNPIATKKSGTLRVAFPTTPDTADVPSLMAHEILKAQGYTIEPTFFASPDVEVAAVAKGDMKSSTPARPAQASRSQEAH